MKYTYPSFWASNVKFHLKSQIAAPDGFSSLNVAQKLFDKMSWNFAYTYMKLLGNDCHKIFVDYN